jgi:DNA-binding transcriptional regulator YiaG
MDKRYKPISLLEQMELRKRAVDDVLANPDWSLSQVVSHVRGTLRLTVPEMARLAKVSNRTLQDIEAGRSGGTVSTLDSLLKVLGLRLGVQRITQQPIDSNTSVVSQNELKSPHASPKGRVSVHVHHISSNKAQNYSAKNQSKDFEKSSNYVGLINNDFLTHGVVSDDVDNDYYFINKKTLNENKHQKEEVKDVFLRGSISELRKGADYMAYYFNKNSSKK